MADLPSACVIGAGSSGIAALKSLHERGLPVACFEKSDRVGGNWVFGNRNGMSSAYRSLHINTSRERMEYSDFPMPASYPDFPHHTQIAEYFDAYVDHFGVRDLIQFETGVVRAERGADGVWDIALDSGESRRFDMLLVANGHHWDPRWPEPPFPGSFAGEQMHAHHYVDNEPLRDKNVLVVGIGNSAMDIAVESSFVARRTLLSSRRGAYVIPKYLFGRPLDQIGVNALTGAVPFAVRRTVLEVLFRLGVGRMEDYGLPKPDHRLGEAHPTISADFLNRVAHGEIAWRPNVARLEDKRVLFEDGSSEQVDVIVWCTGYKVTFPFFDENFISAPDNDLPLFRRVFKPGIDSLAFIALLQPLGATMPLAEAQGRWLASYLRGEYHLPDRAAMEADIARERERMFKRYVASKRHTMQVDFDNYLFDLRREMRRGARRAQQAGFTLPVAPRAAYPVTAAAP
jgi:cation diffusion facilitator CzcD-associated flavoprotein CzcO